MLDAAFLERLQAAFRAEAEEHLQAMSSGLLELERAASGGDASNATSQIASLVESVFREAHSLKGAARAVTMSDIEAVCQALEDVFALWKSNQLSPDSAHFDPLYASLDAMQSILAASQNTSPDTPLASNKTLVTDTVRAINALKSAPMGPPTSQPTSPPPTPEPPALNASQNGTQNGSTPGTAVAPNTPLAANTPLSAIKSEAVIEPSANTSNANASNASVPDASTPAVSSATSESSTPVAPAPTNTAPPQEAVSPSTPAPTPAPASSAPETIRVSTAKLDALLLQAEEMIAVKMMLGQRLAELRELEDKLGAWHQEWNKVQQEMRGANGALPVNGAFTRRNGHAEYSSEQHAQPLSNKLLDFLQWNRSYVQALEGALSSLIKTGEQDRRGVGGLVDTLLEDTKKLLMQPFSTILAAFPKLVRDVARDQNKEVDFEIKGGEVEIDKRLLEEMKSPLTHLLRNAVDHGLESTETRLERGKSARGKLAISISQTSGKIEIVIADDGGGIDPQKVKAAAIKNNIITIEEADKLSESEALDLIFKSAVSTSPIVTEISGRGLGMAIVREKVENAGGQVSIETAVGRGTTFRIQLPLTLATFRGLLVRAGDGLFVLPTTHIERVLRVRPEEIKTVEGRETIVVDDQVLGFARLRETLGVAGQSQKQKDSRFATVVVLGASGRRLTFEIEEVLDEQEVLLKSLGKPLVRVRNIAGATVLGSGQVVPVLHVADLLKSAVRSAQGASTHTGQPSNDGEQSARADKRILVTDDSITSRMLIKNILEAAGYTVQTATDGMDALTELRSNHFDLLVSDVDMPRLDGFGLTAGVRADEKLREMPVVLVTGRSTREDRERGIDVGANAYIVKSSFDQNNLLDVVQRFV